MRGTPARATPSPCRSARRVTVGAQARHLAGRCDPSLVYGFRVRITLTTTGRRSGMPRAVELYAFPDGDGLVVTGSLGGAARHPAWAINLRAEPMAQVKRGRQVIDVVAREAAGHERDRLWRLVSEAFPMYESYQRRTTRRFPIFVLEPRGNPAARLSADRRRGAR